MSESDDETLQGTEPSAVTQTSAPSPTRDSAVLERGSCLGRYVVLERLGAGGMGVVYAAYDPELDRKIALKLVRNPDARSGDTGPTRLQREAQAMAKLSHHNVITVHDVGVVDGRVFIAMEFVDGQTLSSWLGQRRSWTTVLDVFTSAGAGLIAAHEAGIVHDSIISNALHSWHGKSMTWIHEPRRRGWRRVDPTAQAMRGTH